MSAILKNLPVKGEEVNWREGRGALVYKRGRKHQHAVSPVYKLYSTTVKATFRVWCLYSNLVDVADDVQSDPDVCLLNDGNKRKGSVT
jgi:hypothetical protein